MALSVYIHHTLSSLLCFIPPLYQHYTINIICIYLILLHQHPLTHITYPYIHNLPPFPFPPLPPPDLDLVDTVFAEEIHVKLAVEVSPLVSEEATHQVHAVLVPPTGLRWTPVAIAHQLACKE